MTTKARARAKTRSTPSWMLALWTLAVAAPAAFAESMPIDNFHVVSEGIYRGARPGIVGMAALATLGVRTDINLDDDPAAIREERRTAEALGIRFVNLPMSGFWMPKDSRVDSALETLADPANYPVYVHCRFGKDRTGVVVGLHRVMRDGWSRKEAYAEMLDHGFHPELFLLKLYFDRRARAADSGEALVLGRDTGEIDLVDLQDGT